MKTHEKSMKINENRSEIGASRRFRRPHGEPCPASEWRLAGRLGESSRVAFSFGPRVEGRRSQETVGPQKM